MNLSDLAAQRQSLIRWLINWAKHWERTQPTPMQIRQRALTGGRNWSWN